MSESAPSERGNTTTARRGEYSKSRHTRQAILDAAMTVFAESGYRAGSLREIAARVGMSEAGMLHHFPNKGALLAGVLERRDDQAFEIVDTDAPDGADTLRGLVELAAFNATRPGMVELYCTLSAEGTSPDHPAHAYFVRRYETTRSNLTGVFERIAATGRLNPRATPSRAAIATLALMDGLQVQWLLDRSSVDMSAELAEYFRELVEGF